MAVDEFVSGKENWHDGPVNQCCEGAMSCQYLHDAAREFALREGSSQSLPNLRPHSRTEVVATHPVPSDFLSS